MDTIVGIRTVVKFHENTDLDSPNRVLTRTLGKFGVVSHAYEGTRPRPNEFWLVEVVGNKCPEQTKGCLLLEPIKKLDFRSDVGKLVWGMYTTEEVGPAIVLVTPNPQFSNSYWQLPLDERKKFKSKAVIVKQIKE